MTPRRLFILGSTGSIGTSALDVLRDFERRGARRFEVVGLAAARNEASLASQAAEFSASAIALAHEHAHEHAHAAHGSGTRVYRGASAVVDMLRDHARRGDLVLASMVGAAGIEPVLVAIAQGCDIALANKEALVAAGALVIAAAERERVRIIPVDSEHNALFQCLKSSSTLDEVARVVLTASGGPFRLKTRAQMERATVAEALAHPTWKMGPKVTIDSATLMNKALELIEAHWLFGLDADRIDAIVHPQSIVHGFVEYRDGSVLAQLSPPDMRTPIANALCDPQRFDGPSRKLDFAALRSLDFEPVDHDRFPSIALAHRVIRSGNSSGATLNAANEVAVAAFLRGELPLTRIAEIVASTLDALTVQPIRSLSDVLEVDRLARARAEELIGA